MPIGLLLARTAKELNRSFERALADAGGSLPIWLILLSLKRAPGCTQRELAGEVGIREATLTHHLGGMERGGLITRRRDPANRRVHQVTLTDDGEAAFHRLREAAGRFDRRLCTGIPDDRLAELREVLRQLADNAVRP
jgi:MarR family transcriptional regulator, transcriptional regulator for hemolysin